MTRRAPKRIDIALQGGGSHGAFTWGVLDRLLEEPDLEIAGISGASAGAMNAVALAQGLIQGGHDAARDLLREYWTVVSEAARYSPVRRSLMDRIMGRWSLEYSPSFAVSQFLSRNYSPYELNPMDINPLRDIVERVFDFDAINAADTPQLFLSATNVRTGRAKVFRQPQITVDAVLASACLPTLFKAVEIDGEAYWDGGFMGNPPLFPLIDETPARDIILVQVNPFERNEVPKTAYEIENRLNEITFNASLMKELRSVVYLWELIRQQNIDRAAYRDARLHLIGNEPEMTKLSVSSKMNAEPEFVRHLHAVGRETAARWLEENFDALGTSSTWHPRFLVEESLRPAHLFNDDEREKLP